VVAALIWSYQSIVVTLPVLLCAFIVRGERDEMWRLAALLMLGALITLVIFCFMPAVASYTYYGPDPRSVSEFVRQWPLSGTSFLSGLLRIHGGHLDTLDVATINGIVTFPSYHGIMGLILIYQARGIAVLFWPYLAINLVMLVSTVPVGGHYMIDCVGSVAVFAVSVAILDACEGKPSFIARMKLALAGAGTSGSAHDGVAVAVRSHAG